MDLIGFRADILIGEQAPLLASNGLSDDVIDPYQAYLQFLAPVGNGINFYAGKFVTLAGYEVIEAKDNPNNNHNRHNCFLSNKTHSKNNSNKNN